VLHRASARSVGYGIGAAAIAFAAMLFGLFRRRIPEAVRAFGTRFLDPAVEGLRAVHSGVVGDYVMCITVGTAVIGGVWALTLTGSP
jgi:hypothetical protein